MNTIHIYGYHREGSKWVMRTADYQGGRRITEWTPTGDTFTDWRKADAESLARNREANGR